VWRPERGRTVSVGGPDGPNRLEGTVRTVKYLGAYTELEVDVRGVVLRHWTTRDEGVRAGDAIAILIPPDAVRVLTE
jgi:hypothetical protein